MNIHDPAPHQDPDSFDNALSARLAKLGQMPVDTTTLDRALRAQIPAPAPAWRRALRPISAIAAGLVVVALITLAMLSSRPARASAADMAQMHRDIVDGKVEVMKVESIDKALKAFTAMQGTAQMPAMGCCLKDVAGRKVLCILLESAGSKVTLAIAGSGDCLPPVGSPTLRDGQAYYLQRVGDINMVSFERQNHRICLMGDLPSEKLMELTDGLKF